MGKVIVDEEVLNGIGSEIIAKGGAEAPMKPSEMPAAIQAIPSGEEPFYPDWQGDDGDTHLWVKVDSGYSLTLNLRSQGDTVVDFGDGTAQETITGAVKRSHTYSVGGTYRIDLKSVNGSIIGNYGASEGITDIVFTFGTNLENGKPVLAIEVGNNYFTYGDGAITQYQTAFYFSYLTNLQYFRWHSNRQTKVPNNILAGSVFNLHELRFPASATESVSMTGSMYSMETLELAPFVSISGAAGLCIKNGVLEIKEGTTSIGANAFQNISGVRRVILPASLTSIGNTSLCRSSRTVDEMIVNGTAPASLGGSYTFSELFASGAKIKVPYSADHSVLAAYKAATIWTTYANLMEEQEPR